MDPLHGLPPAADWSLRLGDAGRGLTIAALVLFVAGAILPLFRRPAAVRAASWSFGLGCVAIAAVLGILGTLFAQDQFQYQYVFSHSDKDIPLSYKIAAIWTAQEGSFLLWAFGAALFGLLALPGTGPNRPGYLTFFSLVLGTLTAILAFNSPFGVQSEVVRNGQVFVPPFGAGMVPSLQNYWVIIHPPTIMVGFGALTLMAAYAVGAMVSGNVHDWVARVRPWSLATLAILGLGVCMGGLWAYETQGWGGFWAWDPVENVSLVPWLLLVVFVHGLIIQSVRGSWAGANLLLAGLPFLLFVYGTFLTRSGLLDKVSVHSFVAMDANSLQILRSGMIAVIVGYLALWGTRGLKLARAARPEAGPEADVSREKLYRYGMLLLSLLAVVIALGMSWPVFVAMRGGEGARVEEGLYHLVVVWFFIPVMLAMAVTPYVSWRGEGWKALLVKMNTMVALAIGATGFTFVAFQNPAWGVQVGAAQTVNGPFGSRLPMVPVVAGLLFLCWFVALSSGWRALQLGRKLNLTAGGFVAHFGLAVVLGGLVLSRGLERKSQEIIQAGGAARMLDYTVRFEGVEMRDEFDRNGKVRFAVDGPANEDFDATPGMYWYRQGEELKTQVWPFVKSYPTHDVYLALHPPVYEVWSEAQAFKPGETREIDGITVTYVKTTRQGEFGQAGTKFGGEFIIKSRDGVHRVSPYLELMEGGAPQPSLTPVGGDFYAAVAGMDAKTQELRLRLMFQRPLYPVELFTKPLTSLVWGGTGILFLGGLMSAVARRRRVPAVEKVSRPAAPDPTPHAPVPAPQS